MKAGLCLLGYLTVAQFLEEIMEQNKSSINILLLMNDP